jgi:branched-subunit amino acid aminotransferase/4-amino-4-deoxychorismate lyase
MGGVKWWVHHTFSTEFPWVSCGVNRFDPVATLDGHPATETELQALALLNYGHFTTMLATDLRGRGLSLHLDRLARDCHRVFDTELDRDRVRWVVRQALADTTSPVVVRVPLTASRWTPRSYGFLVCQVCEEPSLSMRFPG